MAAQQDQGAGGDRGPTEKQMSTVVGIKWRQLNELVADRWELLMKRDVILVLLVQAAQGRSNTLLSQRVSFLILSILLFFKNIFYSFLCSASYPPS